jgi:hypothetical protein
LPLAICHLMPKHIYDQYRPGDKVEIIFAHLGEEAWRPAVVLRAEPPGIWVQTADGQHWFMTNTYRIRPASSAGSADSAD